MTLRMPGIPYLGPPDSNWGGGIVRPPKGMVVHIAEGSYWGTIGWQQNPVADVSSYFVTSRAGDIAQMLDLDLMAWTQANGNPTWIGVENEGFHTEAFTDAQVTANARIFAWLRTVWPSIPAQVSNSPNTGGLGWHGMGGAAWGNHPDCPGPPNVALLPTILARATGAGPTPPPLEAGMSYTVRSGASDQSIYLVPGGLAPSGKIACFALYGAVLEAHSRALPMVQLPSGVDVAGAGVYDITPKPWPPSGSGGGGTPASFTFTGTATQK